MDSALALPKPPMAGRRDGGLGAAGDHDVGVAVFDHAAGIADAVGGGGAGGDHGEIRSLEAVHDRQIARDHVDDAHGNVKRRNPARSLFLDGQRGVFDRADAADAGAEVHADALGVGLRDFQPRILDGLDAGGHAELDEAVHAARFLFGNAERGGIEILDLAGDGGGKAGGIELRDAADAAFAGEDVAPVFSDTDADRETGYRGR